MKTQICQHSQKSKLEKISQKDTETVTNIEFKG